MNYWIVLEKADIYLVSIRVPRDYEGRINKLIMRQLKSALMYI